MHNCCHKVERWGTRVAWVFLVLILAIGNSPISVLADEIAADELLSEQQHLESEPNTVSSSSPSSTVDVVYDAQRPDKKQSRQLIDRLVQRPEFGGEQEVERWRLKDFESEEEKEKIPDWIIRIVEFFENNNMTFARIIDVLGWVFWLLVISIACYLLVRYRETIQRILRGLGKKPDLANKPEVLFGLDVRAESLPDDIVASAKLHWSHGQSREAISLLYRSSLSRLLHVYDCSFEDGYTENECLQQIRLLRDSTLYEFMQILTSVWQSLAYGHITPEESVFLGLCTDWNRILSEPSETIESSADTGNGGAV